MAQAQRARALGMLLIPFEAGARIPLRRAPEVAEVLAEAVAGTPDAGISLRRPSVMSLRELLGLVGAHEWRRKASPSPRSASASTLVRRVFADPRRIPDLVARAPLPATTVAFDIGTGTGVIAALLARRGWRAWWPPTCRRVRWVARRKTSRASGCWRRPRPGGALGATLLRELGRRCADHQSPASRVELLQADLFPPGRAPLVVCNPPWVPPAELGDRARGLRPRQPHAARLPRRPGGTPGGRWRGLADPVGPRRTPSACAVAPSCSAGSRPRTCARPRTRGHPSAPRQGERDDPLHAMRTIRAAFAARRAASRRAPALALGAHLPGGAPAARRGAAGPPPRHSTAPGSRRPLLQATVFLRRGTSRITFLPALQVLRRRRHRAMPPAFEFAPPAAPPAGRAARRGCSRRAADRPMSAFTSHQKQQHRRRSRSHRPESGAAPAICARRGGGWRSCSRSRRAGSAARRPRSRR